MMSITPASSGRSLLNPVALINIGEPFLKTTSTELVKEKTALPLQLNSDESDVLGRTQETQQKTFAASGMTRTKTLLSLSVSSSSSSTESGCSLQDIFFTVQSGDNFPTFGMDLRRATSGGPEAPIFDSLIRRHMEPHLRKARLLREKSRSHSVVGFHSAIATSVGVPYTRLRRENPFLYDLHTHPLHEIFADTVGIKDLTKLHDAGDLRQVMSPFLSTELRRPFQEVYDNFVTSFCIPLLHSMAMSQNLFHGSVSRISYRYQAFPKIRIVRPGDASRGPECGTSSGLSIGCLHFHVPLTAAMGTNALYTESHPGKENWHPLITKSVGLGFLFDGARCLHFNMENTTTETSVALDFVVAIYNERMHIDDHVDGETLCNEFILEDRYSDQGFYDEAMIDLRSLQSPLTQLVAKKRGNNLLDPVACDGFPFDAEM